MNLNDTLTIRHYKEPLRALKKEDGYGYMGALSVTLDGTKVQCHICGVLRSDVGRHVSNNHGITARQYKDKFQLSPKTALLSEAERERRKNLQIKWWNSLSVVEKKEFRFKARKGWLAWKKANPEVSKNIRWKESLEKKNLKGTCPDQLLQKIRDCEKELGRTPSRLEFITFCKSQRFIHLIQTTFGSWTNALKMLGLTPKSKGGGNSGGHNKYVRYSDEMLLGSLLMFYESTGKIPTESDAKRRLIPNGDVYRYRFGGIPNARKLAGIKEEPIHRGNKIKELVRSSKLVTGIKN